MDDKPPRKQSHVTWTKHIARSGRQTDCAEAYEDHSSHYHSECHVESSLMIMSPDVSKRMMNILSLIHYAHGAGGQIRQDESHVKETTPHAKSNVNDLSLPLCRYADAKPPLQLNLPFTHAAGCGSFRCAADASKIGCIDSNPNRTCTSQGRFAAILAHLLAKSFPSNGADL